MGEEGRRLPANVRPSILQLKQRQGGHDLAAVLYPVPSADGLSLQGLEQHHGAKGQQQQQPKLADEASGGVAQFKFELVRAVSVGPTGFEGQRAPLRSTARVAIFDRQHHRFLGNVHEMRAAEASPRDQAWRWQADCGGSAVVRCCKVQPDPAGGSRPVDPDRLVLLVELNVALPLAAEDAAALPQDEEKASSLVDELTLCWAMISFGRCADLAREMEITVPLYMGSPYNPVLLSKLCEEERRLMTPIRGLFSRPKNPTLTFRAGPARSGAGGCGPAAPRGTAFWAGDHTHGAAVAPLGALPSTVVTDRRLGSALAAWRAALGVAVSEQQQQQQEQQQQGGALSNHSHFVVPDAALAAFPGICRDEALLGVFLDKWGLACEELVGAQAHGACAAGPCDGPAPRRGRAPPPAAALAAAFRRCALEVAPLLRCASLPPRHASNFAGWSERRAAVAGSFCFRPGRRRRCLGVLAGGRGGGGGGGGKGAGGGRGGGREARHPVEPLSLLAAGEFLHRPLDAGAEARLEVGFGAAAPWLAV